MQHFLTFRKYIIFLLFFSLVLKSNEINKKFVVVIDAGHGGEDTGAKGFDGVREKDVTLDVALLLGELIQLKHKDVKVIYTRETDVFIPLIERARIANKNKADLFISIHCNASKNTSASGTETYVLGLHRNDENFEVSKRENSVIFLEDNYKEKYEGFNPNAPESVIGLTLLQNIHLDNSILIAKSIEDNQTASNKLSRGVKQAGFLVLRQTAMPSILTEIGFITNPEEGTLLASLEGKNQVVDNIYNSFKDYKEVIDDRFKVTTTDTKFKKTDTSEQKDISYKIQLLSATSLIKEKDRIFKKLTPIDVIKQNDLYKYFYGETKSQDEAKKMVSLVKNMGFQDAFVTEFNNKNTAEVYNIQLLSTSKKKDLTYMFEEKGIKDVQKINNQGVYKYYQSQSKSLSEAKEQLIQFKKKGFNDAFIVLK